MGWFGGAAAQVTFPVLMEWAYGNIFVWGGRFSRVTLNSIRGRALKIRFWEDVWCGDRPLKAAFPGLFNIASFKEASIVDNVERSNGATQWNIQFTRLIHDWEVEVLASFYQCLYSCKLREDGDNKLWVPSRKGGLEVKSFYRALSVHGPTSVPWKSIWRSKAPLRVAFFCMDGCS
jgi:hypothetical protein